MLSVKPKISSVVTKQIPEFIKEQYQTYVSFIEAYYEFLESQNNSVNSIIRNLEELRNVDSTFDDYVKYLSSEFLTGIPEFALSDKRYLIKHIKDMYSSKGTPKSYDLLFRILYNETPEFAFPKEDVLRPSDGKWIKNSVLKANSITGNPLNLIGQTISQASSSASARVESVIELRTISLPIFLITINKETLIGEFSTTGNVTGSDNVDGSEIVISLDSCVIGVVLTNAGSYYSVGQLVSFFDVGSGVKVKIQVGTVRGGGLEGVYVEDPGIDYEVGELITFNETDTSGFGAKAVISEVDMGGGIVAISLLKAGQSYKSLPIALPPTSGSGSGAKLIAYGSQIGRIASLDILDAGFGYSSVPTATLPVNAIITGLSGSFTTDEIIENEMDELYTEAGENLITEAEDFLDSDYSASQDDLTAGVFDDYKSDIQLLSLTSVLPTGKFNVNDTILGDTSGVRAKILKLNQAEVEVTLGALSETTGFFRDSSGMVSEITKHIEDSFFYQDFSYVIKVGQSIETYRAIVKKLLHPAGMALFGEVELRTLLLGNLQLNSHFTDIFINKFLDMNMSQAGIHFELFKNQTNVPWLGHGISWLEKWKFFFQPYDNGTKGSADIGTDESNIGGIANTQIKDFANIIIGDVINNSGRQRPYCRDASIAYTQWLFTEDGFTLSTENDEAIYLETSLV